MTQALILISQHLCPYVQRAVIALSEKGVACERLYVDLAHKPGWFQTLSPLGKTPVLKVGNTAIFESAVILEYLEETQPKPMHPADPLQRAEHRALIEYASAVLNEIAGFYAASDPATFELKRAQLERRFGWLEARVLAAPWFDGDTFSLVDAAFGPVFRYFDVFDGIADFGILAAKPKLERWRAALGARPSIRDAAGADYPGRLRRFLAGRNGHLSRLIAAQDAGRNRPAWSAADA